MTAREGPDPGVAFNLQMVASGLEDQGISEPSTDSGKLGLAQLNLLCVDL